jgi:hypothetical protein
MADTPEIYVRDPSLKKPLLISSIPSEIGMYSFISGTVGANSQVNFIWTTEPDSPQLSLWNFHWTLRLDADAPDNEWPYGSNIIAAASFFEAWGFTDALRSNDLTNQRVNIIVLKNLTAGPADYFLYFKSYSFANSIGATT